VSLSDLGVQVTYCANPTSPPAGAGCIAYPPSGSVPADRLCSGCSPPPGAGSTIPKGFTVTVVVAATTFQVVTPLVRPFFCGQSSGQGCPALVSSTSMYYEGATPT
jgi:hypothetical protein